MAELFENKNKEIREDILLAFQGLAAHIERLDDRCGKYGKIRGESG